MSRDAYSVIEPGDGEHVAPVVRFPPVYNLAADLVHRHVAQGRGERVAVIDDDGRHSWAELSDRVDRVAAAFSAFGVLPEQRVLLCLTDGVDFPALFLGAIQLGAVPVPVNTLLAPTDYAAMLRDSRAVLAVASDALHDKLAATEVPGCRLLTASELRRRCAEVEPRREVAATSPDDVAFWLYSSGSTGRPKGAVHLQSHPMMTAALYAMGVLGLDSTDVVYSAARLFFAYGLGNALTFPFAVGATAVLSADRPTPAHVASVIGAHRPTVFSGVPTLYAAMLAKDDGARFDSLRLCVSAGEALPRELGLRWRERHGVDILDGIGSTEMLHIFLSNRPGDVAYGTTGRAVPGYQLRLIGDEGTEVGDGESGALWVSGPTSAVAYWNNRALSLETFHGKWTRTGDRYTRGADGRYTYEGRTDDMLKVGGIWVAPFEVESTLSAHPDVLEAAVVGHPDEAGLVKPRAYVVLRDRAAASPVLSAALQQFVKARLAPYKYPRWIDFVDDLPKTANGKIQRFRLRGALG